MLIVCPGCGLQLPSLDEMREIEPSSRLYVEGEATFMTATVVSHSDDPTPTSDAITFILILAFFLETAGYIIGLV